jgi:hypothetical protein
MGVKSCSRRGCDDIMCGIYSTETGYICGECKIELEEFNPTSVQDVKDFMDSEKATVEYLDSEGNFSLSKIFG